MATVMMMMIMMTITRLYDYTDTYKTLTGNFVSYTTSELLSSPIVDDDDDDDDDDGRPSRVSKPAA